MLTSVPNHKAPFNESTIGGRYAANLFVVASKQGILSQVGLELSQIKTAFDESIKIKKIIKNPILVKEQKELVNAFCSQVGAQDITKNFLMLLIENSRFSNIASIEESYTRMVKKFTKEEAVYVVSATELDAATKAEILDSIKEGLELEITSSDFSVNSSIMGGLQVHVGDRYIDLSLEQKYKKIHDELHALLK